MADIFREELVVGAIMEELTKIAQRILERMELGEDFSILERRYEGLMNALNTYDKGSMRTEEVTNG